MTEEDIAGKPANLLVVDDEAPLMNALCDTLAREGTKAVLRIDQIAVTGEVDYCNPKNEEYRICITVGGGRSDPRFRIDEPGSLTVLGDEGTCSSKCRLTDLSQSGLGLKTSADIKIGSMVCVQTASMLAVGEVRHRLRNGEGTFHVGVEVTDVLCNEFARRQKKGFRKRIAELILGYSIDTP
jgi:hypothetical protein